MLTLRNSMYCFKCGKKIDSDSKFCEYCGANVQDESKSAKVEISVENQDKPKNKQSILNWFLWWQVDDNYIQRQVKEYTTSKITASAKGVSSLLLLFSATVTVLFIVFANWNSSAFVDAALFIILSFFIFKGYRWAIIAAMLLWTYEKIYLYFEQINSATATGSSSPNIITTLIWWTIYMHALYTALKVENLRKKMLKKD